MLVDNTEGIVKDQTLWSDPIKTRKGKSVALFRSSEVALLALGCY